MSCFIAIDTKKITNITTSTLNTGGLNILSTDPIVEKGIVYSYTSILPTIGFSNKEIYSKKGVGKFDVTLQGLSEGFTYYVRAYAISNTGDVSYGRTLEAKMLITAQSSCSMNVSLPVGKIYTIPDGYTLVGSSNNGSLQSTCIDVANIQQLSNTCYGLVFTAGGGGTGSINFEGIILNNVTYNFNTILSFTSYTDSDMQNQIFQQIIQIPDLHNLIDNLCVKYITYGSSGTTTIYEFLFAFHGVPGLDINSYLKLSYNESISGGYKQPMNVPIKLRSDLPTTVGGITLSTLCSCT